MLTLDDFDYALPPELIAQHPSPTRSASRLLAVGPDHLADLRFDALPGLIAPGSVMVFNDTKVIKARLAGVKDTGGRVEILVERVLDAREVLAHVRASKSPKAGGRIRVADAFDAEVLGRQEDLFHLRFETDTDVLILLERHGSVPLPPYITHAAAPEDESRYQTVYARHPGAVAAPTAGLHFDEPLLARLRERGVQVVHVTLHVGAGTFLPVRVTNVADHRMHSERFHIGEDVVAAIDGARAAGHPVVAVGTTSLRALEGAARGGRLAAGSGETDIFITPGFRFAVVDRLVTNFHLPRSTLMMLVSAFAGMTRIREAYAHAVRERYRFFSYGDAMLLDRAPA
jgi:S-adenosylmethionine:tRNA ribosyltransferase-isomerase